MQQLNWAWQPGRCQCAMLHAETLGLFVWESFFSDSSKGCRSTYTWMKTPCNKVSGWGRHSLHTYTQQSFHWGSRAVVTWKGKRVIIQGETCHARKFQTMNKFTWIQLRHSLMVQICCRRCTSLCVSGIKREGRQSKACIHHCVLFI